MKQKPFMLRIGQGIADVVEVYIPAVTFAILFVSFVIGIVARYFFNNPQSWTFEVSSICYLATGVLSWGVAHRNEEHIVFDMLYSKLSPVLQCVLRIVSNFLITATAAVLIMPSISYLEGMKDLTTQIIKIPRYLVFVPFAVSFVSAVLRGGYRMYLDIRSLVKKDYACHYGRKVETV